MKIAKREWESRDVGEPSIDFKLLTRPAARLDHPPGSPTKGGAGPRSDTAEIFHWRVGGYIAP